MLRLMTRHGRWALIMCWVAMQPAGLGSEVGHPAWAALLTSSVVVAATLQQSCVLNHSVFFIGGVGGDLAVWLQLRLLTQCWVVLTAMLVC